MLFIRISCNKTFGLVSLLWPPSPPRPTTQCHLFCCSGKKYTLFPLQWLHCYLHTHGEKRPLCLSITKAILTVAQWRTRGSVYCLTERKRGPLGESLPLFCFGKEMDSWHFPRTIPCELFLSPLGVCSRIRHGPGF